MCLERVFLWILFCFQNCSDLLWEKNCSIDQEKKGWEFENFLRWLGQFIQTVKVQNNLWNRMLFLAFSWRLLRSKIIPIQIGKNEWGLETYRKSWKRLRRLGKTFFGMNLIPFSNLMLGFLFSTAYFITSIFQTFQKAHQISKSKLILKKISLSLL